ncbi:MAG: flagellar motor switch protein FliG [Chlamydiales bacterium]|jgi:flagellar motor switch protein FliG|nr:flagellar motor switch protein FliG [Chlamydiales bacterium]
MPDRESEEISFTNPTSSQKLALLLIALGQKWATEMMRLMKPEEVKKVSFWINRINYVPQEVTEKIIREFYDKLVAKTSLASTGGREYLMDILVGMMGDSRAKELIEDLSHEEENEVFRILKRVEPRKLASYFKHEQPQTVALMMGHLDPQRAAAIISEMPNDVQFEVLMRMAKLEETDQDIVNAMEESLTATLGSVGVGKKSKKVGGAKAVAEVLNFFRREGSKSIMDRISETDVNLAGEIKDMMFVFTDIVLIDDKSMQSVLKEIEQADIVLALKGANDEIRDKVFRNISKRQADTINDEISFLGAVKSSSVHASQQKIVNIIRKLDQEGKIVIQGKGNSDDVIK